MGSDAWMGGTVLNVDLPIVAVRITQEVVRGPRVVASPFVKATPWCGVSSPLGLLGVEPTFAEPKAKWCGASSVVKGLRGRMRVVNVAGLQAYIVQPI